MRQGPNHQNQVIPARQETKYQSPYNSGFRIRRENQQLMMHDPSFEYLKPTTTDREEKMKRKSKARKQKPLSELL